ncbi:MAG: hypothetical protein A2072_02785 [Nitrospirae bacterium GWC1_57_7]|jgi:arylsulfatase A-like enzyme|nr:MAG: hypothetical protein A2072_02785 [Nitrospirae bacterium GWC1_57_7]OGW45023.1 MAG: hypothetical protein A2X57_06585 [Nitrospirae bacterium GWD2_57_8]
MRKDSFCKFAVFAVCACILFGVAAFLQPSQAYAIQPNIIIINMDDMGWGDLCRNNPASAACLKETAICDTSDFGAQCKDDSQCVLTPELIGCKLLKSNTPRLDRLASSGVTLTNFYTPTPLCTPSRAALMTGRDPRRTGATDAASNTTYLKEAETTLAEVLFAAGYNTAIVGKWNLSWGTDVTTVTTGKENNSWNQGFEYNYMLPVGVHYGHKGFCLAKKYVNYSNKKTLSATTWHYVGRVLDYSFLGDNNLPDQYDVIDDTDPNKYNINISECNPALNNYTLAGTFPDTDPDYSLYTNTTTTKLFVWNGFWKFSKGSSSAVAAEQKEISLGQILTNRAKEYIANSEATTGNMVRDTQQPFFLYLGYLAPHTPMRIHLPTNQDSAIKAKCEEKTPADGGCKGISTDTKTYSLCVANCEIDMGTVYADVIHEIDTNVGDILKVLDETEDPRNPDPGTKKYLRDNTIVIFTSDNGPFMSDGNEFWPLRSGSTGDLRGGKKFTYEGGVKVPFIARWPGIWPAPGKSNTSIQLADMMDIFPTLIKAAGGIVENTTNPTTVKTTNYDIEVDGKDISSVLGNGASSDKDIQISWFGNHPICVLWDDSGVCSKEDSQDSHPFAIRSNVSIPSADSPIDPTKYKIFFSRLNNGTTSTNSDADIFEVLEFYDLSSNLKEEENANLCNKDNLVPNRCNCRPLYLYTTDSITSLTEVDCEKSYLACKKSLLSAEHKTVVENLWKRAFQYQCKARMNE